MSELDLVTRFSALVGDYLARWKWYEQNGFSTILNPLDNENNFQDDWGLSHYFSVGGGALRIIVSALISAGRVSPRKILDFPSGSGRVTRHLRAMFPESEIAACDLYDHHIKFCADEFGAIPILSRDVLDNLDIGKWDLIFCGSLLTHLPEPLFRSTLNFIARSLSDDGLAVVTLEGRHSIHIQGNKWKFIQDDLFDIAQKEYEKYGFGFVGYPSDFMGNLKFNSSYGVTLISPERALRDISRISGIRILGYTERAWDDHQDVVVFGRPDVNT